MGGPIRKNKLFLFGSFDGTRIRSGTSSISTLPTAAERTGNFSAIRHIFDPLTTAGTSAAMTRQAFPGDIIPKSRWDPLFPALLALYPATTNTANVNNYYFSGVDSNDWNSYDFKGDENFNDTNRLSVRYSRRDKDRYQNGPLPLPADGGLATTTTIHSNSVMGSYIRTLSPTLNNELRIGQSRMPTAFDIPCDKPLFGIKGIPKTNFASSNNHGVTRFTPAGYSEVGSRSFWPNTNNTFVTQFNDVLFKSAGSHGLKAGFEFKHENVFRNAARFARGQLAFNREFTADPQNRAATGDGLAEFMLGSAAGGSLGNENGENLMANSVAAFIQDDWRVSPRLTVNLGLRYDIFLAPTFPDGKVSNFLLDYGQLGPSGRLTEIRPKNGSDCGCEQNFRDFAPRLGLTYRVTDKTVLRSGFGIIYAQDDSFSSQSARWMNQSPDFVEYNMATIDRINLLVILQNGFPAVQLPATVVPGPASVGINVQAARIPDQYSEQWFFDLQRELPFDTLMTIGYSGNGAHHQIVPLDYNLPYGPAASTVASRRNFPYYTNVIRQLPLGNSSYNALLWKVEKRFSKGLSFLSAFTWAHTIANYAAEYGDMGGAQVNVVTKSGTNELHGDVFEFLRNDVLDTRSPFDPSKVPPFRLNQFGGSAGGAIVKNKSFFFASYEGLRQRLASTAISFVPSAAVRSQILAVSPQLKTIIDAYPVGQVPVDSQTNEIIATDRNPVREDSGLFRFDQRFNDKTTMYARFSIDDSLTHNLNGALGSFHDVAIRPMNAVLDVVHIFSPRTLNEFKFGVNRSAYRDPTVGIFPIDVTIGGSAYTDLPNSAVDLEIGTTFSWIDSLTHTGGRHTWKVGGEIRRIRLNNSGNAIDTTTISYASINDFISNRLNSISDNGAEGIHGMRHTLFAGYVQDEFKATPNLTLNLGLRYEYYSVTHEVLGRAAVFDIPGCGGQCPHGTPYYFPDYTNFAPRLGVAWSPPQFHGKTVIRTGYGLFFVPNQNDDFSDPAESTAPRFSLSSAVESNLSYPITPFLGEVQTLGLSPKAIDRHRRDGYYESWNFMIQSELPRSFAAQIGYLGGEGHRLFNSVPTNLLDPVTRVRPLPNFGQFSTKGNSANNNFHSLQAQIKRSFTNGFLWQANYAWSHAITDASSGAGESIGIEIATCRACDRSNAAYDIPQTFTTNLVYELPFGPGKRFLPFTGAAGKLVGGWELSTVATARSGLPINVTVSRSASVMPDGNAGNQRPNVVPGVSLIPPGGQTLNAWINRAAFAVPTPFTWGNAGRYIARGPGEWEDELALSKRTPISDRFTLNFRAEAFNLFNHPNFGNPNANFSSGAFGRITSILNTGPTGTGGTRKIEFMLRLEF